MRAATDCLGRGDATAGWELVNSTLPAPADWVRRRKPGEVVT